MPPHDHIESAIRIAREAGGLNMPHVRAPKTKAPPPAAGIHTGPIHSSVAGRTDHLPMGVPSGSYVLSADVVSHLGENNTAAGFKNLKRMFSGVPRGGGSQPYNASGGPYGMANGGTAKSVPIIAAGGEHVLDPDEVRWAGGGDLDTGHKVLDQFCKRIRKELIRTLQRLAPPKKD